MFRNVPRAVYFRWRRANGVFLALRCRFWRSRSAPFLTPNAARNQPAISLAMTSHMRETLGAPGFGCSGTPAPYRPPRSQGQGSCGEVDTAWVIVVFALFAVMLGAAGSGLVGLGSVMATRGEVGAGLLSLAIGVLVLYGAYLFARVARRTRRAVLSDPSSPAERTETRKRALGVFAYALTVAAGSALTPVLTPVRVIGAIGALLVLPLLLAREFEPPKSRSSTHRR